MGSSLPNSIERHGGQNVSRVFLFVCNKKVLYLQNDLKQYGYEKFEF